VSIMLNHALMNFGGCPTTKRSWDEEYNKGN
jgi:hypothetical protein